MADVNYYPRYPAHYIAKTMHLTMEQDGAYNRLLDWYYLNERPIPNGARYAITRAMTASERKSVDSVLAEFFTNEGDAWSNDRTEGEIATAQPKIAAAKANGKKGGRPRKNPAGSTEKPTGFITETHSEPTAKAPQSPIPKKEQDIPPSVPIGIPGGGTDAGKACKLMRAAGCVQTNPSNADLQAAIREGITPESLADYALAAVTAGKGNPFTYAIAAARGDHARGPKPVNGDAHANRPQRSRVGLADRNPRPARDDDAIPGEAIRIHA